MALPTQSYDRHYALNQDYNPNTSAYVPQHHQGIDPMQYGMPTEMHHVAYPHPHPFYTTSSMTMTQMDTFQNLGTHTTTQARMGTPQRSFLEVEFKRNPKPSTEEKTKYAAYFNMPVAKINNWFQNRRASAKRSLKEKEQEEQEHGHDETESDVNTPPVDGTPSLSEGTGSISASSRNTVSLSPKLELAELEDTKSSFASENNLASMPAEPAGALTKNVHHKGLNNSLRRDKKPQRLNLTHNNRTASFAMPSPNSLPTSPGFRPTSSSKRRTSTPGITPHAIQKARTFNSSQRSPHLPQEYANQLANHLSSLPTGITSLKTQLPTTSMALPTPPLATDASMTSLRSSAMFPFSHAPETPITPANGQFPSQLYAMNNTPGAETPEISRYFNLRGQDMSPMPSSAATHFNIDTPPHTAPPSQSAFMDQEIYQPFPRGPLQRIPSNIYLPSSPVPEEGEGSETGAISFHVPFTSHDSHTPTIQFPTPTLPMNYNHGFQNIQDTKKESSPYEESLFQEMEPGVQVFHGVPLPLESDFEDHTPVPVHDAAPGYEHVAISASAGFNKSRPAVWRG